MKERKWKEWCKHCNKYHIVSNQPCPSCGVYYTPQPSEKVQEKHGYINYDCDGCDAYKDHLR